MVFLHQVRLVLINTKVLQKSISGRHLIIMLLIKVDFTHRPLLMRFIIATHRLLGLFSKLIKSVHLASGLFFIDINEAMDVRELGLFCSDNEFPFLVLSEI